MTDFANFLFINDIPKTEIAKFLGISNSFVTKMCKGEKNLPEEQRVKIIKNSCGWDTAPLEGHYVQTIRGNNIHHNSNGDDCELWKKLCEEKDKRIAELERTIQILMAK